MVSIMVLIVSVHHRRKTSSLYASALNQVRNEVRKGGGQKERGGEVKIDAKYKDSFEESELNTVVKVREPLSIKRTFN